MQENMSGTFAHLLSVAHLNSAKLAGKHYDTEHQIHNRAVRQRCYLCFKPSHTQLRKNFFSDDSSKAALSES